MRVWGWGLCIAAAASAAACGLDNQGLLEVAAGDDAGPGLDAAGDALVDAPPVGEDGAPSGDGGPVTDAGSAGDVDFDSPPPPPPDASPWPLAYDGGGVDDPDFDDSDWVTFCVGLAGCGEVPSISRCLGAMPQPGQRDAVLPNALIGCVMNATSDCGEVAHCVGGGAACPTSTPDSCSGDVLSTCRWGFQAAVDCTQFGMVCSAGLSNPGCGFGDCAAWQQGQRYCAGQYLVVCDHGRYTPVTDCGVFGATCSGSPPAAACVGTGGGCSGSTPTCAGAVINECLGGQQGGADCSQLYGNGFQCFPGAGTGSPPFCAQGTMCTPSNADSCDNPGKNAQFCNAGKPGLYDCSQKSLGWGQACQGGRCSN